MSCASPIPWDALVAYWAGDLDARDEAALEEHAMGCAACSAESARVAAITETIRAMPPMIVTRAELDAYRAEGKALREQSFAPGNHQEAWFGPELDMLAFRLGGLDLSRAASVSITLRVAGTEHVIMALHDVPFARDEGEVILLCQRHFESFPPKVDAEVRARDASGAEERATYTIDHRFGARR